MTVRLAHPPAIAAPRSAPATLVVRPRQVMGLLLLDIVKLSRDNNYYMHNVGDDQWDLRPHQRHKPATTKSFGAWRLSVTRSDGVPSSGSSGHRLGRCQCLGALPALRSITGGSSTST